VRQALRAGATDEDIVKHLDTHGTPKTPEEIRAWSDSVDKVTVHGDPEKGSWFDDEYEKLGLDGAKTTMSEWLEADDRASYQNGHSLG
jgi:hypothetical protein